MRSLIIGAGEIGRSLSRVLGDPIIDKHDKAERTNFPDDKVEKIEADTIHICFPFSAEFESEVKKYQALYQPKHTVIHSTVPPGTSRRLQALHSPVIGMHPNLADSLVTFTKFIGGEGSAEIAEQFRRKGMRVYLFDKQETTELMKILDTTFYGVCIEYTKDVKRMAEQYGVPFEAWTLWTENYNDGYEKMGHPEFRRPNLTPIMKEIGGHCVLPNCDMIDTKFAKFIKQANERE